jgi:hypothetical protein
MNTAQMLTFLMRRVGSHGAALERAKRLATFPVTGHKRVVEFITTHSTLCAQFAERIGLDHATCAASAPPTSTGMEKGIRSTCAARTSASPCG